jgi:hypothetical protein
MQTFLMILTGLAMAATLGVMFAGMIGLARTADGRGARSNRLMRWRVGLQFTTVVLLVLLLLTSGR